MGQTEQRLAARFSVEVSAEAEQVFLLRPFQTIDNRWIGRDPGKFRGLSQCCVEIIDNLADIRADYPFLQFLYQDMIVRAEQPAG